MSLMLPDSELDKIGADSNVLGMDCCESCARNIARAQARHMAREIQAYLSAQTRMISPYEMLVWLRQEEVLDAE
jgi:hypothetical protein